MAATKLSMDRKPKATGESTSGKTKEIHKSSETNQMRRRFDDNEPSEMQSLIAKQLSDYLDSNIEEVTVDSQDDNTVRVKEQADDFQLFSTKLRRGCISVDSSTLKNSQCFKNSKKADIIDSSSSDDDSETIARLTEVAVSVEDILGYKYGFSNNET